jgi:hypothetical protein
MLMRLRGDPPAGQFQDTPVYPSSTSVPAHLLYEAALAAARAASTPPSAETDAWLGNSPIKRSNCWVTSTTIPGCSAHPAGKAKDGIRRAMASGIWPKDAKVPLLAYVEIQLDTQALASEGHPASVRPSFADKGNNWFRIISPDPAAVPLVAAGWGAAFDLLHLVPGSKATDVGLPECVMAPLRCRTTEAVVGLSWLEIDRAKLGPAPSQSMFDDLLFCGRDQASLHRDALALAAAAVPLT